MITNLSIIRKHKPCKSGYEHLVNCLCEHFKNDNITEIEQKYCIDHNFVLDMTGGVGYIIWFIDKEYPTIDISEVKSMQLEPSKINDASWKEMREKQKAKLKQILGQYL